MDAMRLDGKVHYIKQIYIYIIYIYICVCVLTLCHFAGGVFFGFFFGKRWVWQMSYGRRAFILASHVCLLIFTQCRHAFPKYGYCSPQVQIFYQIFVYI